MPKLTSSIQQYLSRYAEPTPETPHLVDKGPFSAAAVVPVCGENSIVDALLDSLDRASQSSKGKGKVLVLLVVNENTKSPAQHRKQNQELLLRLGSQTAEHSRWPALFVNALDRRDHCTGVGHARKQGADLALSLWAGGVVKSSVCHTTDADARVGTDYFDLTALEPGQKPWGLGPRTPVAYVHTFVHEMPDTPCGHALGLYDRFLRAYHSGLSEAGSPFAYPTIGSCIAFDFTAYAEVRGFPKREAAEDFYFLHKVAKLGFVWLLKSKVTLVARESDRVPFGTGRSIAAIQQAQAEGKPYRVIHPAVFHWVGLWMECIRTWSEEPQSGCFEALPPELRHALEQMGVHAAAQRIGGLPAAQRHRHWHTWFDGFRTLRLVHLLRDSVFGTVVLEP